MYLQVRNIFNKGQHAVFHTVKTQKYITLDFVQNQNPIIIPYQFAGFWGSMYDQNGISNNRSIQNMKILNSMSWGVEWLNGTIDVEVYAVTRQRLIQQGATNYLTFDFETSQNLFIAEADRNYEGIDINNVAQLGPNVQHTSTTLAFDENNDTYTKEEIPQRMIWSKTIHFPHLQHNYAWKPIDMSDVANVATLIPGGQGQTQKVTSDQNWNISKQHELIQETTTLGAGGATIIQKDMMQPRVSYPRLHFAQPLVTDETGIMKFQYKIRFTTELNLKFHLNPDFTNGGVEVMLERQRFTLPVGSPAAESTNIATCICMPYTIPTYQ